MTDHHDRSHLNRSEQDRNRLFRRADWRFLLPESEPGKSVCFGDGLLDQSVVEISGQVVRPGQALPGECDLAVATCPNVETIQFAWRLLRPGGTFYAEWGSLQSVMRAGGQTGIRQRIKEVGFARVRAYWAWPPPERKNPSFWLPLDAPQALNYFLENRALPSVTMRRLTSRLMVTAWRLGLRTRLLAPISMIACKPDSDGSTLCLSRHEEAILKGSYNTTPDSIPEPIYRLLLTGGWHSSNKVIALLFAGQEKEPRLALKYPRVSESIPAIIRERDTLRAIQTAGIGTGACLPRVIYYNDQDGGPVLGETPVLGQPLYKNLNQESYRPIALKVTAWLSNLVLDSRPIPRPDWWERIAAPALADFQRSFGPILEKDDFRRTADVLETLGGLPLTCEQRDCSPWNLLINPKGELVVLDWESAEFYGLPGLDLIYFLTYLGFFYDGAMDSGAYLASYQQAKNPLSFTGRVRAECEQTYLQSVQLGPTVLRPLRLLTWLIHSRSDFRKMNTKSGGHPTDGQLRSSLFYQLWRAELNDESMGIEGEK